MDNPKQVPARKRGAESRTAAYFDRLAQTYGTGEYYCRRRAAVLAALSPYLRGSQTLLDLGCGNGTYLAEFARMPGLKFLVGVDLSAEMLFEARRRLPAAVRFIRADVAAIPLRSASFDFVFASHVLPFVDEPEVAAAEIARCLRLGSLMAATTGDSGLRELRSGLSEVLGGSGKWRDFERAVFGSASRVCERTGDFACYRRASLRAGLTTEEIEARFGVSGRGLCQWIRLRWMPQVPEPGRGEVEELLARLMSDYSSHVFPLTERLLLGRKPV